MSDDDEIQEYARGEVSTRHGRINAWLLVVYVVLAVWGVVYLMLHWGGLGPGLGG
jgi:TRAP-type mannitol/chloroaromatic compound transport system permease small subunit